MADKKVVIKPLTDKKVVIKPLTDKKVVIKPLTDADVDVERKIMYLVDQTKLDEIFTGYNNIISSVFTKAIKQVSDDEEEAVIIDSLRRMIRLLPTDEKFIRTKDKVYAASEFILERNEEFFLKEDISYAIKKDKNQFMMEGLISIIRTKWPEMTDKEKDFYWGKMLLLLNCVNTYNLMTEKYRESRT